MALGILSLFAHLLGCPLRYVPASILILKLAYIFCIIFNACFSTNTVPTTRKNTCIVPVPKRPVISSMNDLRPVSLTSAVMKVCERVVPCKLKKLVKDYLDPLLFAYRKKKKGVLMIGFYTV